MDRTRSFSMLKGQTFKLPKMTETFSDWSAEINPHLSWLRQEVDAYLTWIVNERFNPQEAIIALEELQRADIALLGAAWFPNADAKSLRLQTLFVAWLFLWRHEVDSVTEETVTSIGEAQLYHKYTLEFVEQSLGLQSRKSSGHRANILVQSFEPIGAELRSRCTIGQREKILEEIYIHIQATAIEQRRRSSPHFPSIHEYMDCRMGTSAVGCVIAMHQACENIYLPRRIEHSLNMKMLWDCTNVIISTANDIVSLKNELAKRSSDNLIPLLWLSTHDLQMAVDEAAEILEDAKKEFNIAAEKLYKHVSLAGEDRRQLEALVDGCKYCVTGNLTWSLESRRYLGDQVGSNTITLT